jgi:MFS family permease
MTDEPSARVPPEGDIDYRLIIPFLTHVTLVQTLILVIRITTSYRAIELGLPVIWLGIIATGFAIIPVFTALQVGRWIDRGNDARAAWLGSALVFTACISFWAWPRSAMHLLGFSVLLGFGHMFCMAGHQMLAARSAGKRSRETALGYYMVAASIGQGLGPFVVGWLGGAAALPPTGLLFAIGLAVAGASVIVAALIRPAAVKAQHHDGGDFIPIRQLLALRGFAAVMIFERGDHHRLGSAGDLSSGARGGTPDRFRSHRPLVDRSLGGFAGLARLLRQADLCHRPQAAHLDEHARQRRGISDPGVAALAAGDVRGSHLLGIRNGHRLDPDAFRRHVYRAA